MKLSFQRYFKVSVLGLFCIFSGLCHSENIDIQHLYFHEIESTQAYAIEYGDQLLESPNQWAIISADRQTHGVGLRGDQWVSSCPNNLYVTFLCSFPKKVNISFFYTPLVAALSVEKTLKDFGLNSQIKWINDVVVNGKKISGVLCEWIPSSHPDFFIVLIGIGLNVNMTAEECSQIDQPATSIYIESGLTNNKNEVLQSLLEYLCDDIEQLKEEGFDPFKQEIEEKILDKAVFSNNLKKLMKNQHELQN